MIDRDELRIARRTAERNGYTVLPPREDDERDLDRFRMRQRDREDRDVRKPAPRFRDEVEDVEPRPRARLRDDEAPKPRFRPLRSREDDFDDERPTRTVRHAYRDDEDDDYVPVRKPIRREDPVEVAKRTAEENGYTVRKMSRLELAKKVAQDAGFDVRKISDVRNTRPAPTAEDDDKPVERPARRVATRDGAPIRKPVIDREFARSNREGIRTRTAPDTEIKNQEPPKAEEQPKTETPKVDTPAEQPPKKTSYEDDYVNRAAAFFGDDD